MNPTPPPQEPAPRNRVQPDLQAGRYPYCHLLLPHEDCPAAPHYVDRYALARDGAQQTERVKQ